MEKEPKIQYRSLPQSKSGPRNHECYPLGKPVAGALAAVARKLRDREVLRKLRSATSGIELFRAVTE